MSRFALRIFISTWILGLTTVVLTVLVSTWLTASSEPLGYDEQMVMRLAADIRRELPNGAAAVERLLNDHPLFDVDRLVEIYVFDAEGREVRGRVAPGSIRRLTERRWFREGAPPVVRDPRLSAYRPDLGGYTIVSDHGRFPAGRLWFQPFARFVLLGIALIVSATMAIVLGRFIVLPVRRLRLAGQRVAEGDLSVRVAPTVGSRTDDIAELARDFDVMTERVQALLGSQQRLMRDVSHELRSPLARLQALLSIARQKLDDANDIPIDRMERELERVDELIGEILSYARLETLDDVQRRPTDLVDLIQNIADDAEVEGHEEGKQVRVRAPESCMLEVDSGLIQGAVENVVRNAVKHTAPNTAVEVTLTEQPDAVRITVRDHGPGVPEEALPKLFDPFFRVEEGRATHVGSGGIGLAIAQRSVRLHGGTIGARNDGQGGLRIEMLLPR